MNPLRSLLSGVLSSGVRRRFAPPFVALTVLGVLLGGGYALRGGSAATPGGGPPSLLRLADWQPPTAGNQIDSRFRLAADLPAGPDHAAVRRLTSPERAGIERLALALGLRGGLTSAGGASTYTTADGSLRVQEGAGGQWQFSREVPVDGGPGCPQPLALTPPNTNDPGPVSCVRSVPVPLAGDATTTAPERRGAGAVPAPRSGGTMKALALTTPAAARAAARPVLEAVGIDPDSTLVRAQGGAVSADPTVENLPTQGLTTTVLVTGTRINSASGWLGGWQAGDAYPVISARAAWEQLMSTPQIRPLMACPEPAPDNTDPMICGGPVTVVGARFGLSLHEDNGQPLLVPSWLFDVRGSQNALSVVAVDPRYLAEPPPPTAGSSEPGSTGSTGSGSAGTGSTGSAGATGTSVPPVAPSGQATTNPSPPPDSRFSSVTAAGAGLVVAFTGGVRACFSYRVVPTESDSQVALTLVETTSSDKPCVAMAQVYERRVALVAPLGTRQVVDADTGAVLLGPAR